MLISSFSSNSPLISDPLQGLWLHVSRLGMGRLAFSHVLRRSRPNGGICYQGRIEVFQLIHRHQASQFSICTMIYHEDDMNSRFQTDQLLVRKTYLTYLLNPPGNSAALLQCWEASIRTWCDNSASRWCLHRCLGQQPSADSDRFGIFGRGTTWHITAHGKWQARVQQILLPLLIGSDFSA